MIILAWVLWLLMLLKGFSGAILTSKTKPIRTAHWVAFCWVFAIAAGAVVLGTTILPRNTPAGDWLIVGTVFLLASVALNLEGDIKGRSHPNESRPADIAAPQHEGEG